MQDRIYPGEIWLDTTGKPIHAHGFSVFYSEPDGCYYWYGENKEHSIGGPDNTVWHWGVRCYRSHNLCDWEDMGLIIPPQPEDLYSPLHPTYCMDRPHILYCKKTGKFVAWLKIMCGLTSQFMTVMQADRFLGPYEFVHKVYKPLGMDTGDFALWEDENSGNAYFIFERPHFELITATLNETYTEVTGEYSVHYSDRKPPDCREAPAVFSRKGVNYMFTSGTSGYFPNKSLVCRFDHFHGIYECLGDPCVGDDTDTTFNSQITCVLKFPGKDVWIACADRWLPEKKTREAMERKMEMYKTAFAGYIPDRSYREAGPLPGRLLKHGEDTSISRYVWLPVEWDGDKPILRWRDSWSPEEL